LTDQARAARSALGALAAKAGDDPRKLAAVASLAVAAGDTDRAYALACEARRLAPGDAYVRAATQRAISAGVPHWHFAIVRDHERNAAWNAAIERAVTPSSVVLDVGAGTGLLAMMAARGGARRVVSCEMSPAVADAATRIVAANGFAGQVSVIASHSRDLTLDQLGGKADLFVSEIVSNNVVAQDALDTVADVVRRLLAPGGKVIPASAAARVALAWWEAAPGKRLHDIDGFDLSAFNSLRAAPYQVERDDPRLHLRSPAADLFDFDFESLRFPRPRAEVDLLADGGAVNGVVQWIHIRLDDAVRYENRPGMEGRSCWACLFHPFDEAITPAAGMPVRVAGEYTQTELRIWREG
jgi:type II protein arginine methyltransferase